MDIDTKTKTPSVKGDIDVDGKILKGDANVNGKDKVSKPKGDIDKNIKAPKMHKFGFGRNVDAKAKTPSVKGNAKTKVPKDKVDVNRKVKVPKPKGDVNLN